MAFQTRSRRRIHVSIPPFVVVAICLVLSADSELAADVVTLTTPQVQVTPIATSQEPPTSASSISQYQKEDFFWGCNDDKICDASCQLLLERPPEPPPIAEVLEAFETSEQPVEVAPIPAAELEQCRQQRKPEGCRCDYPKCLKYGDCCWTELLNEEQSLRHNYQPALECRKMLGSNFDSAWVVTKCPQSASPDVAALCHADLNSSSSSSSSSSDLYATFSYLLDIPVYSLQSEMIYKNAYCAICHKEKRSAMAEWRTQLDCPLLDLKERAGRDHFKNNAVYIPHLHTFQYNGTQCRLTIQDWNTLHDFYTNPLQVSTLRTCVSAAVQVTSCRSSNSTLWHDSLLCNMYSQYVRINGLLFKNIHCAKCHGLPINFSAEDTEVSDQVTTVPQPSWCFKAPFATGPVLRPGFTTNTNNYGGIHLLFDFSLGDSSHHDLVGLKAKCAQDQVWDYLHQRCQAGFCGPGYYFEDDDCRPLPTPFKDTNVNASFSSSSEPPPPETPANSTGGLLPANCQRLYLYQDEWQFISSPENGTIVVNLTSAQGNILRSDQYEHFNDTTLAICYEEDLSVRYEERFSRVLIYASRVCLGTSVAFSFLHILIYSFVPKLRNLPGKTLVSLTLCIFSSQLLFLTLIDHSKWPELCVSISICLHYAFLASFFWMNVMSFDIWRTFTGSIRFSRNQSRQGQQLTFFRYSVFAWTVPLLIVLSAASVDFAPPVIWPELRTGSWTKSWEMPEEEAEAVPDDPDEDFVESFVEDKRNRSTRRAVWALLEKVKPSYGQDGVCWFSQRLSLFVFFALPVALVMASNLVLFGLTAKTIISQHRTSDRVLNNQDSRKKTAKVSKKVSDGHDEINVKLYAKLALIMGLTWTLGFVSKVSGESWLWFLFVSLNGLQGTFIFFAFDFKVKIWEMVRERWNCVVRMKRNGQAQFRQRAGSDSTKTSHSISFGKTASTQVDKAKDNCSV